MTPRVITVDKNAADPKAFPEMQAVGALPASGELRQSTSLTPLLEQDYRFSKRLVKPGMGFFSCETAWRTVQGYEAINMDKKRTGASGGQRRQLKTGGIYGRTVRRSHLNTATEE